MVSMSFWLALALGLLDPIATAPRPSAEDPTFWKDVRPILQKRCNVCHSTKNLAKKELGGGLALTNFDAVLKAPGDPVIVPSNSSESRLYGLLVTKDEEKRMPKDDDPLSELEIEIIRRWIETGAKEGERPPETTVDSVAALAPKRPATLLRKQNVVFSSGTTIPQEALGKLSPIPNQPGKIDLLLKIAPLPPVTALAYSPDGKRLAVGSYGAVVVWELDSAQLLRLLDCPGAVHSVEFSPDGSLLAAAGGLPAQAGQVILFDCSTWQARATLGEHADVVYDATFSPDGQLLATASVDKTVRVWSLADAKPIQLLKGHSDFVYNVAFTPDGKRLVTASKDRSIKIYSVETWQAEKTLSGHNEEVLALAVTPNSGEIISAGKEPQLRWWNIEAAKSERTISGHSGVVNEIAVSADGKRVASVGQDKTVRIWDGSDGKSVRSITGATDWLYAVSLSPDGRFVAAGSWDGLVRLWETETGRPLAMLVAPPSPDPARPQWIVFCPEGYYQASDDLAAVIEWRVAGQPTDGEFLRTTLRQVDPIRKALRGEVVNAPVFLKPK